VLRAGVVLVPEPSFLCRPRLRQLPSPSTPRGYVLFTSVSWRHHTQGWKQAKLMDALKQGRDLGLVTAVGVSNYKASQLEEAHGILDKMGIPLVSNQVRGLRTRACNLVTKRRRRELWQQASLLGSGSRGGD
jgi:hypothetical protein